jgi:hypothetical protein
LVGSWNDDKIVLICQNVRERGSYGMVIALDRMEAAWKGKMLYLIYSVMLM